MITVVRVDVRVMRLTTAPNVLFRLSNNGLKGLTRFIWFIGFTRFTVFIGFTGYIGFIGLVGFILFGYGVCRAMTHMFYSLHVIHMHFIH
jgi:hypothetical protein